MEAPASNQWTNSESLQLVSKLQTLQPQQDTRRYEVALQDIDWSRIQIGNRRPDEIRQMAFQLLGKIRKVRTLTEMLEEVPTVAPVKKPKMPSLAIQLCAKHYEHIWRALDKPTNYQVLKNGREMYYERDVNTESDKYTNVALEERVKYLRQLTEFVLANPGTKGTDTPFELFWKSCCDCLGPIPKKPATAEWNILPPLDMVFYVRICYRLDPTGKLLSCQERQMLDWFLGKPKNMGRSMTEYFEGKIARQFLKSGLGPDQRKKLARGIISKLTERQRAVLEEDFEQKKEAWDEQFDKYLKNKELELEGVYEGVPNPECVSKQPKAEREHRSKKNGKEPKQELDESSSQDELTSSDEDETGSMLETGPYGNVASQNPRNKDRASLSWKTFYKRLSSPAEDDEQEDKCTSSSGDEAWFDPMRDIFPKGGKRSEGLQDVIAKQLVKKLDRFVEQWKPKPGQFMQDLEAQQLSRRVRKHYDGKYERKRVLQAEWAVKSGNGSSSSEEDF